MAKERISKGASRLIAGVRRKGTTSNYKSSWKKWTSWCSEQQIDPVTCHLNFVLDFLAYLIELKYEYSTINCHRSAISAYYDYIDNTPDNIRKFVN